MVMIPVTTHSNNHKSLVLSQISPGSWCLRTEHIGHTKDTAHQAVGIPLEQFLCSQTTGPSQGPGQLQKMLCGGLQLRQLLAAGQRSLSLFERVHSLQELLPMQMPITCLY